LGNQNSISAPFVYSYRGVSYATGQELWRMNSKKSSSYSRDVDASAITVGDTAYIGLENGSFISFGPGRKHLKPIGATEFYEPDIFQELPLYKEEDVWKHGGNLVTEASPARINDHIYIASGSGHVFGYNLKSKEIDWVFTIGADLDGSPVVTSDGCLLVTVEKQYISGKGGVFKLDPSKSPENCVVWYFPTEDREFASWSGGVIGSVAVNDAYNAGKYPDLAVFTGIDGSMYIVNHTNLEEIKTCTGPNGEKIYPMPKLLDKRNIGPSISTPIFVQNKIVAAGYHGLNLYTIDENGKIISELRRPGVFEASPVADNGKVYIASRNGYLYCLGSENSNSPTTEQKSEKDKEKVDVKPKPKNQLKSKKEATKKRSELKSTPIPSGDLTKSLQNGRFYLVAGAYGVKSNAINEVKRLRGVGINAFMAPAPNGMHYVIVGEADSESSLNAIRSSLKNKHGDVGWVYRK
jgi:outer membrane protein assembly factor BamB